MSITVLKQLHSVALPALFSEALDAGRCGVWAYDISAKTLSCDQYTSQLLGNALDAVLDPTHLLNDAFHPQDREQIEHVARTAITGSGNARFDVQPRLISRDGEVRWLSVRGKTVFCDKDASRMPLRVVGTVRDVTAEKGAEDALRASEARFRESFKCAAIGLAHVDSNGTWLHVNERLCQILGYSADELVQKTFQDITHPDDLSADLAELRRLLANEIDSYSRENRYLHKDGSAIWVKLTVGCVRNADGSIRHFVSVVEEIGERKRQESKVETLVQELNHRSKNILAIVQAIAQQTAASDTEFMPRFQGRLRSLATAQELFLTGLGQVELRLLIASQLAFLEGNEDGQIRLEGPDVLVGASAAQSLGMALHELATNAVKYGAFSEPIGRVQIEWDVRDGAELVIRWVESGGPSVSPPTRKGFGSLVMTALIEKELGGKATLTFPEAGLAWTLECPIDRIVRDGGA